jgi:hypothetical protein
MSQALPQILNLGYSEVADFPRAGGLGGLGQTHRELQPAASTFWPPMGPGHA